MLFGQRSFASHQFRLAGFELALALGIGVVVFSDHGIAKLVALGLARLREQDQR